MNKKILISSSILLISSLSLQAGCLTEEQYPNQWQDSRYTLHNDGTATDTVTGLMWKVCSEGQAWDSSPACTGSATFLTWEAALAQPSTLNSSGGFAGHSDWRLPNSKELSSLVALNCSNPAINAVIFPATPSNVFWSSSPNANVSNFAWAVYFFNGYDYSINRILSVNVRLVR